MDKEPKLIYFFLIIQSILFLFMILHDWIEIRPFTNLKELKKTHSVKFRLFGSIINGGLVLIPLIITFFYLSEPFPIWARILFVAIYGLITFGTITAWWIPYFGGKYWFHGSKESFKEYRDTHTFLPQIGDNVTPNTLHIALHIQVWICFALSLYFLIGIAR